MERNYNAKIAQLLNVKPQQVASTIKLLDDGNTVPFIARYRKEQTFNLDEFQIREIEGTVTRFRQVDDRRDTIIKSITEQGKLTPDLQTKIDDAESLTELEDLYQPYKQKRRTRAQVAREKGLEPLANRILGQSQSGQSPQAIAREFLSDDVPTVDEALQGARDIVAEVVTDDAEIRGIVREKALQYGTLISTVVKNADDPKAIFKTYYDFSQRVPYVKPHQTLAINRGENEKILRVKIETSERDWRDPIYDAYRPNQRSGWYQHLVDAIEDGVKRLLLPAIERDVRRHLSDIAEAHAIRVFADNLRNLLQQPPLEQQIVMGVDPAYRTGCKIAVVDGRGKLLDIATVYPHSPQNHWRDAKDDLMDMIHQYRVSIIAIGNGTASRETEQLIAEITRETTGVHYVIVNEAGASVYSASPLAREELPDLDVSIRGAVSIARRIQDPLAELVKIDPQSIGVGLYQHDVNQTELSNTLDAVVESVVNQVGVDVNTASPALLQYVAGIGAKLAKNIVSQRNKKGAFNSRQALMAVSGMGEKSFEQSAGFLRVRDGKNPLDESAIHPESYHIAQTILELADIAPDAPPSDKEQAISQLTQATPIRTLAKDLDAGELTLADILEQLVRPGRDPREDVDPPLLRSDVLSMSDLKTGMVLKGTVRNVVDFGAFVDIGVKQDGLLHISKFPRGESVSLGDVIDVEILSIDKDRGRIGLGWVE
ncbi:MAG: Tex family protein [Phototrophicaceae bacterium]